MSRQNNSANDKESYCYEGFALLAEDDSLNAELAGEFLKMAGIRVLFAKNGFEAVQLYCENKDFIRIVFLDVQMPVMDGIEAAKQIRKQDKNDKGIPMIALTASEDEKTVRALFQTGFQEHKVKPVSASFFFEALQKYL